MLGTFIIHIIKNSCWTPLPVFVRLSLTFTCVFQDECHWFFFEINSTKENQWSWAFFRIRPVALSMEFYLRTQLFSLRLQILWKDHFRTSYSWVIIDRRFYWKVASKRWRSESTYLLFSKHETCIKVNLNTKLNSQSGIIDMYSATPF